MLSFIFFYSHIVAIIFLWFILIKSKSQKSLLLSTIYGDSIIFSLIFFASLSDDFSSMIMGRPVNVGYTITILFLLFLIIFPKIYNFWLLLKNKEYKFLLLDFILLIIIILYAYITDSY